jgi:nitroreductase
MEFFEVVRRRQSYRGGYKDMTIRRDELLDIVKAGLAAPSGKNAQTTRFVIVSELELVARIAMMHATNKSIQQAKVFIACIIDKNPKAVHEEFDFQVEDCAAAVENMLLAITALGYGSVWTDGWLRQEGRAEAIGKLLGVPDDKVVRVLLPIGVPAEIYRQPPKMSFNERAYFNKYQSTNSKT